MQDCRQSADAGGGGLVPWFMMDVGLFHWLGGVDQDLLVLMMLVGLRLLDCNGYCTFTSVYIKNVVCCRGGKGHQNL